MYSGPSTLYLSPRGAAKTKALQKEFPGVVHVCASNEEVAEKAQTVFVGELLSYFVHFSSQDLKIFCKQTYLESPMYTPYTPSLHPINTTNCLQECFLTS